LQFPKEKVMIKLPSVDRLLYSAVLYGSILLVIPAQAATTLTTIQSFESTSGFTPEGTVVRDAKGNLYGVTYGGGASNYGVVYESSPPVSGGTWTNTVLFSFPGGTNGGGPYGTLVRDKAGNLYGATLYGGNTTACPDGCGLIFQLEVPQTEGGSWTENVLFTFSGTNGTNPTGSMVFDSLGNLYGTTVLGGTSDDGVVFELNPPVSGGDWTYNMLYSFAGGTTDGANPPSGILLGSGGNIFGVTRAGGSSSAGIVYELEPPGSGTGPWTETILYTFTNSTDGGIPEGSLVAAKSGTIYGTTLMGGASKDGTVFELTFASGTWTYSVIHSFTGGTTDGANPFCSLAIGTTGAVYGTTMLGGAHSYGTVFRVSPVKGGGWTESVLYSFTDGKDGAYPTAGVVLGAKGVSFGTTTAGGASDGGVVFKLTL
jgi:uncharacterized repeat protein (TIGR03803 family)